MRKEKLGFAFIAYKYDGLSLNVIERKIVTIRRVNFFSANEYAKRKFYAAGFHCIEYRGLNCWPIV